MEHVAFLRLPPFSKFSSRQKDTDLKKSTAYMER